MRSTFGLCHMLLGPAQTRHVKMLPASISTFPNVPCLVTTRPLSIDPFASTTTFAFFRQIYQVLHLLPAPSLPDSFYYPDIHTHIPTQIHTYLYTYLIHHPSSLIDTLTHTRTRPVAGICRCCVSFSTLPTVQDGSYHRRPTSLLQTPFLGEFDAVHIPADCRQIPLARPHLISSVRQNGDKPWLHPLAFTGTFGELVARIHESEQCLQQSKQRDRDERTAVAGVQTPTRHKSRNDGLVYLLVEGFVANSGCAGRPCSRISDPRSEDWC
jgi:hypothetical protein